VIPNGNAYQVSRMQTPDGIAPAVNIYVNLLPDRDYNRPESFSDGVRVAVFRPRSTQGLLAPGQIFNLTGTVNVESAVEFTLANLAINLAGFVDSATVSFVGAPSPLDEMVQDTAFSIPFSAIVYSAGGFGQ